MYYLACSSTTKGSTVIKLYHLLGETPHTEQIIADVTGRHMSIRDERKMQAAVFSTGLVDQGDCASIYYNGDGLEGKHLITVTINSQLSNEAKQLLIDEIRIVLGRTLSEVVVVNMTGLCSSHTVN